MYIKDSFILRISAGCRHYGGHVIFPEYLSETFLRKRDENSFDQTFTALEVLAQGKLKYVARILVPFQWLPSMLHYCCLVSLKIQKLIFK